MKSKTDPRHSARRLALVDLFSPLFSDQIDVEDCSDLSKELINQDLDHKLYETILNGVRTNVESIDEIITKCAPEWPIDKISKIDLCILRMAIYEIMYGTETPTKVAIDEAVELGKEFGNETTSKFVNGVLGTVVSFYKEKKEEAEQEKSAE